MGWIIGAPSKRRMKGRLSVTKTAFPISNAATNAVKKPLNSMPCSCRIRRLVHRIRLKPTKKKIVGGSACLTCASHQVKADAAIAGWLMCYSQEFAELPGRREHRDDRLWVRTQFVDLHQLA